MTYPPRERLSSPDQLDPRQFPSYQAYQSARKRELTRSRIINMRITNRHLTLREIANHTGVSVNYVKEALASHGLPVPPDILY